MMREQKRQGFVGRAVEGVDWKWRPREDDDDDDHGRQQQQQRQQREAMNFFVLVPVRLVERVRASKLAR